MAKLTGRIVLGKDFDTMLGTGMKLYLNVGANQGVKVGDYFRVVRSYTADVARSGRLALVQDARFRKTRRCTRPPLKPTTSRRARARTFMSGICPGARWAKSSS